MLEVTGSNPSLGQTRRKPLVGELVLACTVRKFSATAPSPSAIDGMPATPPTANLSTALPARVCTGAARVSSRCAASGVKPPPDVAGLK